LAKATALAPHSSRSLLVYRVEEDCPILPFTSARTEIPWSSFSSMFLTLSSSM
jgi:hypothetical protein